MDKIKFKMFGGRKKKEKMKPIFEELHNAYSIQYIIHLWTTHKKKAHDIAQATFNVFNRASSSVMTADDSLPLL